MSGIQSSKQRLSSFGTANLWPNRLPETHPLTWRLNRDGAPVWLTQYQQQQGYLGAKRALTELTPEAVVAEVKEAGLKGRGGANFLAGVKWGLTAKGDNIPRGYVLCNADEMEPNTYKDRLLLEQLPHLLLEGIIIAGYANHAKQGYIFLRGEYIDAARNLKQAIYEARAAGLLGKHLFGIDFDFDIDIHTGAGRYICGEETALLNSLEGYRANPRAKPPFPGQVGAWGKPSVINNVETLANVAAILLNGVPWYQGLAREGSSDMGTKLMGFAGRVKNPGLWELPLGISVREIFEDYANGMLDGYQLKSWQPGGASTGFLLPEHLDATMCSAGIAATGTRMGTAVALAIDQSINMVALLTNMEHFFARESCGWCTPCRDGLPWIVQLLEALKHGEGEQDDIEMLLEMCQQLAPGKTYCAHAPGAIEPIGSAIRYFRPEFDAGIKKSSQLIKKAVG